MANSASSRIDPKTGKRFNWTPPAKPAEENRKVRESLALMERQLAAVESRDDLLKFTQFTMPDPESPNDVGRSKYKAADFHREVAKALQAVERGEIVQLIFCMPPRHGKSELATKRFAAWMMGRHPDKQLAVATYSDAMANDFGSDTRAILASPQYRQVFPDVKLRRGGNAKDNLETIQGGRTVFVGRGGALTGKGAHCLVEGTAVETRSGPVPIERLKPDDEVLSYDEHNGSVCWRRIAAVASRPRSRVLRITTASGRVVEATSDHRFFAGGEWKEACELTAGDRLLRAVPCAVHSVISGNRQALSPRAHGVLLLEQVLGAWRKQAAARAEVLFALWRRGAQRVDIRRVARRAGVLLEVLLGRGAAGGVRAARAFSYDALRALQRDVLAAELVEPILQQGMCVAGAFERHAEREEPELEGRRIGRAIGAAYHPPLQGASAIGAEERWHKMRAVLGNTEARGSPYRREPEEQSGKQSRDALPGMPREGALYRTETDVVVAVEDLRRDADVYDIQVEETECFFANGVLTHNCLLIDDLFKDHEEARSAAVRDQAWHWFTKVAMTRRMGKKLVVITMTRWHSDDVIGRLTDPENPNYNAIEAKKWKIIRLPAIAEEDDPLGREVGAPLWPDGPDTFDLEFLESQHRMDPLGFAALYQQRPTVADGILFRRENIQRYNPGDLPENLRFYAASDHAVGTKQRNDPSCFGKGGVDPQGNLWMTDLFWQRAPSDKAVEAMLAMASGSMAPLLWWAEKGHISMSIGPFLRKRMLETSNYINIREVVPAGDKEQRAQSIAARVAIGKVFIPNGPVWDRAVEEMLAFPNGVHDDFVDMLSLFGIGLQSQFGNAVKPAPKAEPKFGTLAWVKQQDKWRQERESAKAAGGF